MVGFGGVKANGYREVSWFHLLISSPTTNDQGLALFTFLSLSSSPGCAC